jgi:signal transduction histidine kinase
VRARAEYALRNLSGGLMQLQDEERRRLARELHDSTGQLLVALPMNLAVLNQRVSQSDRESADLLLDSMGILDRVVKEIRTLSYLLYPPLLDEAGLPSALQWYIDGLAQRSSFKIDLHISSEVGRLSQELETTIFRIVQECLTNIHRHSGSSVARITLLTKRGQAILRIRDEGRGVGAELLGDPAINPSSFGVGIRGIAERVRELGGTVRIKNAMPGTIVEVILPLQRQDSAGISAGTKEAPGNAKRQQQGA